MEGEYHQGTRGNPLSLEEENLKAQTQFWECTYTQEEEMPYWPRSIPRLPLFCWTSQGGIIPAGCILQVQWLPLRLRQWKALRGDWRAGGGRKSRYFLPSPLAHGHVFSGFPTPTKLDHHCPSLCKRPQPQDYGSIAPSLCPSTLSDSSFLQSLNSGLSCHFLFGFSALPWSI